MIKLLILNIYIAFYYGLMYGLTSQKEDLLRTYHTRTKGNPINTFEFNSTKIINIIKLCPCRTCGCKCRYVIEQCASYQVRRHAKHLPIKQMIW